jgi:hypothetical protein
MSRQFLAPDQSSCRAENQLFNLKKISPWQEFKKMHGGGDAEVCKGHGRLTPSWRKRTVSGRETIGFRFGKEGFFVQARKSRDCAEAYIGTPHNFAC